MQARRAVASEVAADRKRGVRALDAGAFEIEPPPPAASVKIVSPHKIDGVEIAAPREEGSVIKIRIDRQLGNALPARSITRRHGRVVLMNFDKAASWGKKFRSCITVNQRQTAQATISAQGNCAGRMPESTNAGQPYRGPGVRRERDRPTATRMMAPATSSVAAAGSGTAPLGRFARALEPLPAVWPKLRATRLHSRRRRFRRWHCHRRPGPVPLIRACSLKPRSRRRRRCHCGCSHPAARGHNQLHQRGIVDDVENSSGGDQ